MLPLVPVRPLVLLSGRGALSLAASSVLALTTSKADTWALSTFFPACPAKILTSSPLPRCSSTSSSQTPEARRAWTIRRSSVVDRLRLPHRAWTSQRSVSGRFSRTSTLVSRSRPRRTSRPLPHLLGSRRTRGRMTPPPTSLGSRRWAMPEASLARSNRVRLATLVAAHRVACSGRCANGLV